MPHATPSAVLYGDGSGPSNDTERGQLTINPTTLAITLAPLLGFTGGNLVFDAADPVLDRLQAAVDEFDGGFVNGIDRWAIVDAVADIDPKRVELLENSGTIALYSGTFAHTMKIDTVRGLLLALLAL